jgi:hypothetical protein
MATAMYLESLGSLESGLITKKRLKKYIGDEEHNHTKANQQVKEHWLQIGCKRSPKMLSEHEP